MDLLVSLLAHGEIHPGLLIHNALVMAERIESGFAVISTHAAFAYAAKAHLIGSQMDNGIVDTAAAKSKALHSGLHAVLVLCEEIERQRLGTVVQQGIEVFKTLESENGQDGTEDLFLHDGIVPGYVVHDGGRNFQ